MIELQVPSRRWITVREAAELYAMHPKTILSLCRQRRIPHSRVPSVRGGHGQVRVDRLSFDAQLEAGLVLPEAPAPLDRRRRS